MAEDHYSLLGVPKDATSQDIKRAFRKVARECHPDVAGEDPDKVNTFQKARTAYEVLMDPVSRARYDRRGERRAQQGGSFFDAFYKRTGEAQRARDAQRATHARRVQRGSVPGNDLGLDDLLDGFGGGRSVSPSPVSEDPRAPKPSPGRDMHVEAEVPFEVARSGGAIQLTYSRLRRSDTWVPGQRDPGLIRVDDLAEVRILPGTETGAVLKQAGLGDAGPWGGVSGDLYVKVTVTASAERVDEPQEQPSKIVEITVVEALLGTRVPVQTPQGKIVLSVPPGTSSHSRMRVRGKGPVDASGTASDWTVEFRIRVPTELQPSARRLVEQLAEHLEPPDSSEV